MVTVFFVRAERETEAPTTPRQHAKKEKLRADVQAMFEGHWTLTTGVTLQALPEPASILVSRGVQTEEDYMLQLIDNRIWDILVVAVNRELSSAVNISNHDPRLRPTTRQELIRFYGVIVAMENTYGNDVKDVRAHHKALKE
jgi:hypothetical protein